MKTLCFGCMQTKESSSVCEHCGWDEDQQNLPHQLPVGTILQNQYLVGRVVGQGGFGITYMGWDQHLSIPVAIKEYYPGGVVQRHTKLGTNVLCASGETPEVFAKHKDRFMKEARTLAQLSGIPEIVQIKNFFPENDTAYIVMEYVEGITLKEHIKKLGRPMTEAEALDVMNPVLKALQKVHDHGLIHRDISPDNIMLPRSGGVKLIDFGTVRYMDDSGKSKSTEAVLKPGFAPMEQYNSRGNLGTWTDVYAICATFHYLLTGKVPADVHDRLDQGENLTVLRNKPGISQNIILVLESGMKIRAQDRVQTIQQLTQLLYMGSEATIKTPEKVPQKTKKKPKKQSPKILKWLIAFGMIGVLLMGTLFLMGALSSEKEETSDELPTTLGDEKESIVTDGEPIGDSRMVDFDTEGSVTVHSFTEQLLSNGYVRYTLAFTMEPDHELFIFDPPNGEIIYSDSSLLITTGLEQSIVFDIALSKISRITYLTLQFYSSQKEDAAYIYALPYQFDNTITGDGDTDPMQLRYMEAADLEAAGEYAKAAIAFGKLGDYLDSHDRSFGLWDRVAKRNTIATGFSHFLCLKNDGTVLAAGSGKNNHGQCDVETWNDIIAVAAGPWTSVGLKADGTVVIVGYRYGRLQSVFEWTDIVAIDADYSTIYGLKKDGSVISTGNSNAPVNPGWSDIIAIDVKNGLTGLKVDGTVLSTSSDSRVDYSGWGNIVQIDGDMGLKADGTVVIQNPDGSSDFEELSQWTDIVAISRGSHAVGLCADGTVKATGWNENYLKTISKWTDMVQIYSGRRSDQVSGIYVMGLRKDGRVVSVGNSDVLSSVQQWQDVIYLYTKTQSNTADEGVVVGIKSDGTVVTNLWCMPQYGVSEWMDIKLPQ